MNFVALLLRNFAISTQELKRIVNIKIKTIAVIGAGTMGNGIAHVSALSGFDTILMDIKDKFVQQGLTTIQNNMVRQVKKEKISQSEMETSMSRITASTDYHQLSACDW